MDVTESIADGAIVVDGNLGGAKPPDPKRRSK